MISLRVLFFVTLAVWGLAYVRAAEPWNSTINFVYKDNDILNIIIIFKNVPPRADRYVLYSQTDAQVKNGPIQRYETIVFITQKLDKASVTLSIELTKRDNKVCSTKIILDGVRDLYADKAGHRFRDCLNNYDNSCEIIVDFENKCKYDTHRASERDRHTDEINCTESRGRLTCEIHTGNSHCESPVQLPEHTVHQWYQRYGDDSSIGTVPPVKGKYSKFIIGLLKFDDNTYIYSKMNSAEWKKEWFPEAFKISANGYKIKEYDVTNSKSYSELEQVNFTCPNNAQTQIGWINPTGDRITTYDRTSYSRHFRKTDNSSMLCCLHYTTYNEIVERSVDAITVLIYKEPVNQDNAKASSSPEPEAPRNTALQESLSTLGPPPSDKTKYYIVIASVAGIIILISIIYVAIKKCSWKSSDREQTLQLETYASTNTVLYAELDIRPGDAQSLVRTEDPTYAKIIGVLRPQNENVKK